MIAPSSRLAHERRGHWTARAHRGEEGAALIIALVVMISMGVLVTAILSYAQTNAASVRIYRDQRTERYAGDAAIKAAVNWAATQPKVARDGTTGLSNDPCISTQTVAVSGTNEQIKVSCKADDGGVRVSRKMWA